MSQVALGPHLEEKAINIKIYVCYAVLAEMNIGREYTKFSQETLGCTDVC